MNRRQFVGQVLLGSSLVSVARPSFAAQPSRGLGIKFVGMMGYVTRSDQSLLVAMPGAHRMGNYSHVPFLMARTGSPIAQALGMTAMPGVVAGAFDMELADAPPDSFMFRCLDGADLEVTSGRDKAVRNRATQLAQMQQIAPGKRLRNNLRRWSQATVTVDGGVLNNSAAHPDAGKVWSFGRYRQRLTDATLFRTPSAALRLSIGPRVWSFDTSAGDPAELWVVSAAGPRTDPPNPRRLEHGHLLFEYFAQAEPIVPTCEEAEGRIAPPTEMPCAAQSASMGSVAVRVAPPHSELCPGGGWCCE